MPGLFGIFEIGRGSLLSYQSALTTTGHNVANANSPGFHRQRVELGATPPIVDAFGAFGSGVRVDTIRRVEDRFLEATIQREIPVLSRYSARATVLSQTEVIFNEPSDSGITTVLDQFFDGWDDLASNPEDLAAREAVVRLGMGLAGAISTARARVADQQKTITLQIDQAVDESNAVIRELRAMNQAILSAQRHGQTPGDLEDRRDLLITRLGDLMGTSATIEENGTATVRIGGRILLQNETIEPLDVDLARSGVPRIHGVPLGEGELDGMLGGLVDARDNDLAQTLRELDEFAARLVEDVNALHEQGVDAHGNPAGPFFTLRGVESDGVSGAAAAIEVALSLQDDSSRVAAGVSGPGDNAVALDIAALRSDPLGVSAMLQRLVVGIGSAASEAEDLVVGQQLMVESFLAQRDAISGVSLDEEAANLMQYQRSYQAAARMMTIADEMAQTILSL